MINLVALEDNHPPKDKWLRVEWNLGKRCNYDCSYCGNEIHDNTSEHLSLVVIENTIKNISNTAKDQNKICRISLTGGEPFVHPKIIDILKIIKQNHIEKISVTSNGSVPLKKYLDSIPFMNYYIFSYHFEYAYHEKIINTIIELNKEIKKYKDKSLHVHLMYLPGKIKEAKEIISLMNENNVKWAIRRIRPRVDPETLTWAKANTSGMKTIAKKVKDDYYTSEDLEFLLNTKHD